MQTSRLLPEHTYYPVPDVGHGNPLTAFALAALREQEYAANGNNGHAEAIILTNVIVGAAQSFHSTMSRAKRLFSGYRGNSESTRVGLPARALQASLWLECRSVLERVIAAGLSKEQLQVIFVQEFTVLGMAMLGGDVLTGVPKSLYVPDIFPKISAERAAQQTGVTLLVHNQEAYDHLHKEGIPVELQEPLLVRGMDAALFSPRGKAAYARFQKLYPWLPSEPIPFQVRGAEVVVKSSGSGMPHELAVAVQRRLEQSRVSEFHIHLPNEVIVGKGGRTTRFVAPTDKWERILLYMLSVGHKTQVLESGPSESTAIVYELQATNGRTMLRILGEPRGTHEITNAQWITKKGWVVVD